MLMTAIQAYRRLQWTLAAIGSGTDCSEPRLAPVVRWLYRLAAATNYVQRRLGRVERAVCCAGPGRPPRPTRPSSRPPFPRWWLNWATSPGPQKETRPLFAPVELPPRALAIPDGPSRHHPSIIHLLSAPSRLPGSLES
jgi:hypothetical protein